jgi:hypothetical protein
MDEEPTTIAGLSVASKYEATPSHAVLDGSCESFVWPVQCDISAIWPGHGKSFYVRIPE